MQLNPFRHHASRTGVAVFDGANLFVYDNGKVMEHIPQQQAPRQPVDRPLHDPYAQTVVPQFTQQSLQQQSFNQHVQPATVVHQQTYVTPQGQPCDANGMLLTSTAEPTVVTQTSGHSYSAFFEEDEDVFVPQTNTVVEQHVAVPVGLSPVVPSKIDLTRFDGSELDDSELEMMLAISEEEAYNEEISMNAEDHIGGLREHRVEANKVTEQSVIVKPTTTVAASTMESHKEPEQLMQWADDDEDDAYSTECILAKSVVAEPEPEDDIYHGHHDDSPGEIINAEPVAEAKVNTLFIEVDDAELDVLENAVQTNDEHTVTVADRQPAESDNVSLDLVKKLSDHFNGVIPDDVRIDPVDTTEPAAENDVTFSLAEDEVTPAASMDISHVLEEINTDAPMPAQPISSGLDVEVSLARNSVIASGTNAFNITAALKLIENADCENHYSLIKYETVSDLIIPKDVVTPLYTADLIIEAITSMDLNPMHELVSARILRYVAEAINKGQVPEGSASLEVLLEWLSSPIWHKNHCQAIFNLACIGSNETKFNDDDDWIITATAPSSVIVLDAKNLSEGTTLVSIVDAAIEDLANHYGAIAEEFGCARMPGGVLTEPLTEEDSASYMPCVAGYLTAAHGHKVIIRDVNDRISMYTFYKWDGRDTAYLKLEYTF